MCVCVCVCVREGERVDEVDDSVCVFISLQLGLLQIYE